MVPIDSNSSIENFPVCLILSTLDEAVTKPPLFKFNAAYVELVLISPITTFTSSSLSSSESPLSDASPSSFSLSLVSGLSSISGVSGSTPGGNSSGGIVVGVSSSFCGTSGGSTYNFLIYITL